MEYKHDYKRIVLFKNDDIEVVEIEWQPGQMSPAHKHGECCGLVQILEGSVHEELFEEKDGKFVKIEERDFHKGQRFSEEALGIHRISNTTDSLARSLHVYLPPAENEIVSVD